MTERYCEWCHTATGLHLPDCPTVIPDPYADDQQPARAGTKVRGRIIHTNGYPMIYMPSHPRATVKGYVSEHVLIVEKAIGKFL